MQTINFRDEKLLAAENLIVEAFDGRGVTLEVIALATATLTEHPDCSLALHILADNLAEPGSQGHMSLLRRALYGAEKQLRQPITPESMRWECSTNLRRYFEVCFCYAVALWEHGAWREAIRCMNRLRRLYPDKAYSCKMKLLPWYLTEGNEVAARRMFKGMKDDGTSAACWTQALLAFKDGMNAKADTLLRDADRLNPFVAPYLLITLDLPEEAPSSWSVGNENEAILYVADYGTAWMNTANAIEWVNSICRPSVAKVRRARRALREKEIARRASREAHYRPRGDGDGALH